MRDKVAAETKEEKKEAVEKTENTVVEKKEGKKVQRKRRSTDKAAAEPAAKKQKQAPAKTQGNKKEEAKAAATEEKNDAKEGKAPSRRRKNTGGAPVDPAEKQRIIAARAAKRQENKKKREAKEAKEDPAEKQKKSAAKAAKRLEIKKKRAAKKAVKRNIASVPVQKFAVKPMLPISVFVTGMADDATKATLVAIFNATEDIKRFKARVYPSKLYNQVGFVTFRTHKDAVKAAEQFNGKTIDGHKLSVVLSEYKIGGISRVFVTGLSKDATLESVMELFKGCGTIMRALRPRVGMQADTEVFFAVLTFATRAEAGKAVEQFDGKVIDGQTLHLFQKPKRVRKAQAEEKQEEVEGEKE
eukprot:TRINITY_DN2487_c0_g1_i1.p2 TRINITY_DN2487_c0_g1~~TRINITY_DN2487_c0_g1_i1.p2  ORF type:complete len:367 (+),score=138.36 TRINITY_DN2487_c0_g1_i1:31-1101(+)